MTTIVLGSADGSATLAWPKLAAFTQGPGDSRATVSTAVLLPADDPTLAALQQAAQALAAERWGTPAPPGVRMPWKAGDPARPEQAGKAVVNARSGRLVPVVGPDLTPVRADDDQVVYGGAFARVVVRLFAYDARAQRGGLGVGVGLESVQVLGGGARYGGGGDPLAALSAVPGLATIGQPDPRDAVGQPDPFAGLL